MFMVLLFMWMLMVVPIRMLKEIIQEMVEHINKIRGKSTKQKNIRLFRTSEQLLLFALFYFIVIGTLLIIHQR